MKTPAKPNPLNYRVTDRINVASINVKRLGATQRSSLSQGVAYVFLTLFPVKGLNACGNHQWHCGTVIRELIHQVARSQCSKPVANAIEACFKSFNNGNPVMSEAEYMANGQRHFHSTILMPVLDDEAGFWSLFVAALAEHGEFQLAKMHEGVPDAYALGLDRSQAERTVLSADGAWNLHGLRSAVRYTRKQRSDKANLCLHDGENLLEAIHLTDKQFAAVLKGTAGARVSLSKLGLYTYTHHRDAAAPHRLRPRNGTQVNFALGKHRKHLFQFLKKQGLSLDTTIRPKNPSLLQHLFASFDDKHRLVIDLPVRMDAYSVANNFKFFGYTRKKVLDAMCKRFGVPKANLDDSLFFGEFVRSCARYLGVRYAHNGYCDPVELVAAYVVRIVRTKLDTERKIKHKEAVEARRPRRLRYRTPVKSIGDHYTTPPRHAP
jgi:hypothetical protein